MIGWAIISSAGRIKFFWGPFVPQLKTNSIFKGHFYKNVLKTIFRAGKWASSGPDFAHPFFNPCSVIFTFDLFILVEKWGFIKKSKNKLSSFNKERAHIFWLTVLLRQICFSLFKTFFKTFFLQHELQRRRTKVKPQTVSDLTSISKTNLSSNRKWLDLN